MATQNRKAIRARIHARIRRKLGGTAQRPRLAVYFSNANVYAQIIDDEAGKTRWVPLLLNAPLPRTSLPWFLTAPVLLSMAKSKLSQMPPVKKAFSSNPHYLALSPNALYGH